MGARISYRLAAVVCLVAAALAAGCNPDRETIVTGKWQGDELSSTFAATKMKEDSGASLEDAKNMAKIMAMTFVELRKDKTFTAGMAGATTEGTWTFNKETGEVVMKITSMKGPDQKEVKEFFQAWTAILNEDNRRLSFYPRVGAHQSAIQKGVVKTRRTVPTDCRRDETSCSDVFSVLPQFA